MGKPYFLVKLKDPQTYYFSDETIPCILELRTDKPLKEPLIRIVFKGRSSSYTNANRIHFEKLFDIEQEIKRSDIVPKKTFEIEFSVEAKKGVDIPSSCSREGIDGGKIDYMVEAILETTGFMGRSVKATSIVDIPLIAKINVAEPSLRTPRETSITWPRNEEEINQCRLHAVIRSSGWMRGKPIPVYVSWKQPERYLNAKKLELMLIKQETIASSKDKPPNMSLKLPDKPIVKVSKEFKLERDAAKEAMVMSNSFEIDIPSNITPTIQGNGKVVQIDYKLCVTVFLPEMGPYNQDREVSINLNIVIGTVHEAAIFDVSQEFDRSSVSSSHRSTKSIENMAGYYGSPPLPVHNNDTSPLSISPPIEFPPVGTAGGFISPKEMPNLDFNINPVRNNTTKARYPPNLRTDYSQRTLYSRAPSYDTSKRPEIELNYPQSLDRSYQKNLYELHINSSSSNDSNQNIQYQPTKVDRNQNSSRPNMYPPENRRDASPEPMLPMEVNEEEDAIQKTNRTIEQNIYPPLHDSPEVFEMSSPVCYMNQFENDFLLYSNDSGIQGSNSDENTTLSSKNSCRNNKQYKTQSEHK